jgi:SlyX protein
LHSADDRLEAMESKLAFQEDTLQQLNDALVAQQARIDHLEALIMMLGEQLGSQPEEGADMPEPPPPHY